MTDQSSPMFSEPSFKFVAFYKAEWRVVACCVRNDQEAPALSATSCSFSSLVFIKLNLSYSCSIQLSKKTFFSVHVCYQVMISSQFVWHNKNSKGSNICFPRDQ